MMIIPATDVAGAWDQLHEALADKDRQLADKDRQLADKDLQLADVRRERDEERRRAEHEHQLAAALQAAMDNNVSIERAIGIVAEKGRMTVDVARTRIRNWSRGHGQQMRVVAERIIAGQEEALLGRGAPDVTRNIIAAGGVPLAFWDLLTLNGEIFR